MLFLALVFLTLDLLAHLLILSLPIHSLHAPPLSPPDLANHFVHASALFPWNSESRTKCCSAEAVTKTSVAEIQVLPASQGQFPCVFLDKWLTFPTTFAPIVLPSLKEESRPTQFRLRAWLRSLTT